MDRKHIVIDARIRRASTGRYVDRLIKHLQNIDTFHRYTVLVQPDDDWKPTASNFTALPCPFAQFSLNPLDQLRFTFQLRSLKPDLVHFTMTQQPLPYFGKIVTTTHDLTMLNFVRRGPTPIPIFKIKMGLYRFMLRWSHMKSDKIIVPTAYVGKDLASYQPSTNHKIVVTYEASEPPLKVASKRPKQVEAHDQFIMYVGTAFPHKNLEKLVDAFDILNAKYPDLKLILVGKKEAHYQELEQKVASHPSAGNIIITGFLSDQELKWLYQNCRAYVFASLSEGFGLPGLEAMAHNAPVVSSDASCLPEVYGDAAHYFDATSPEDIALKTEEVLGSIKLRNKLMKAGQEQIKKYSWRHMAEETLAVYKEVLGETVKD